MGLIDRLGKVNSEDTTLEKGKETFERSEKLYSIIDNIQAILIKATEKKDMHEIEIKEKVVEILEKIMEEENSFFNKNERDVIVRRAMDEIVGYGPISPLIENPEITEVMVNGPDYVYVEKEGRIERTDIKFRNERQLMHVIEKIVVPLGRRIDEASPMVDARLPDGSRVNAIIPPLSLNGPVLTVRKFAEDPFTAADLVSFGTMTPQIVDFLKACVEARLNILISGGTGSGKTTTLNVVSSFIPSDERIVTIEDAAELQLHQDHVVRLESRPANIEGKGEVLIRDLVKNTLRMRPDRIIVGEVRSGEALDMLQAMNTGHDGSLTTGHANSPRDMLSRLETMVMMAGMDLPLKAIREQVASAIDLVVQQSRLKDGSRKIVSIVEIQGMENDVVTLQEIFRFKTYGKDPRGRIRGELVSTGIKPKVLDSIREAGVKINEDIFK
ncbi:pilus assembly protein CpaF [Peptoclostridium litorale DSM 5388]|uniref:Putative conjugal transfer protein n=1 Tax=Peptoclostridium litorale DSM 5388 TaxID=1121324 RepID=A0A069RAE6_PEPLI|nr:CpaF family protein [Peptoclostridium litorale]KDR93778.1 putative conjugal transfer protein [Peptoclostridium litorale DSM 5388]SIN85682.1 pilus assembly protein CpaF [Peptoclostridium litorale DSM 5388]